MNDYLEAGKIVNTHGIRGDLRLIPWSDRADFLSAFKTVYIDGRPHQVESVRPHKQMALLKLQGVDDVNSAVLYKNKTVCIARADAKLEPGQYFLQDTIGLPVLDADSGQSLGQVAEVLELPASNVFVIRGEKEHMVPIVPEFVIKVDVSAGQVLVRLIEGM